MSSADGTAGLAEADATALMAIVRRSLVAAVVRGEVDVPARDSLPTALSPVAGCFVTLRKGGELRGCVGAIRAQRPLGVEAARAAYMAALRDPRFNAVQPGELDDLDVHISVLTPPEVVPCRDEDELRTKLRPGVDGVIFSDGDRSGTFLPDVWDSLASPEEFLRQLRLKAQLPPDHWSDTVVVERYTTWSLSAPFSVEDSAPGSVTA